MLIVPSMLCVRKVGATIFYRREFSSIALDAIAKELVDFNWSKFYLETNIQLQANIFYELIFHLVDKYAPLVCVNLRIMTDHG